MENLILSMYIDGYKRECDGDVPVKLSIMTVKYSPFSVAWQLTPRWR